MSNSPAPSIYPLTLLSLFSLSLSLPQLFPVEHTQAQENPPNSLVPNNQENFEKKKEKTLFTHIHSFIIMGKLLCDSTSVAEPFQGSPPAALPWREPKPEPIGTVDLVVPANVGGAPFAGGGWEDVVGLEEQQRRHLQRLHAKGVLWKPPPEEEDSSSPLSSSALRSVVFRLSHGGEVSADGNCLFTASRKAMGGEDVDARELRRRTVARFLEDLGSVSFEEREAIDNAIRHMYSPDLKNGGGIHVVQEVKLLAKKEDRFALDSAIEELVHLGMQRY